MTTGNHFVFRSHSTGLCLEVSISKERMLPPGEVVMVPLYLKLRQTPAHFMTLLPLGEEAKKPQVRARVCVCVVRGMVRDGDGDLVELGIVKDENA